MRIFYGSIAGLTEQYQEESECLLTKERRERLHAYRREEDKKRCLCAGLLLFYGCLQYGIDIRKKTVLRTKEGKPYLKEEPAVHFNVTHAGSYVAAAFDEKEIGIDVERNSRYRQSVAEKICCLEEAAYLAEAKDRTEREQRFALIWTRKESYLKAVGTGLHGSMASFNVLEPVNGRYFQTFSCGDAYRISVCTTGRAHEAVPEWVDRKKIEEAERKK